MYAKYFYRKVSPQGLSQRTSYNKTKATISEIKNDISKKDKILDLGCGYGRITIPLKKQGYDIEGLDISPDMIKEAKKKNKNINFLVGESTNLPYKNKSFDKVICTWSVFNEITKTKEQIKTLNEIYRILKPKGKAIIDVINGDSWLMYIVLLIDHIMNGSFDDFFKWQIPIKTRQGKIKANYYIHTRRNLKNLVNRSKFKKFHIKYKRIRQMKRIFLVLEK